MSDQEDIEIDARPQSRREWNGYLRSLVLPVGLVVIIVGGLLYLQSNHGGNTQESGFGTVALPAALNPTGKSPSAADGRAAPDFLLRTIQGNPLRLSDLQGKPVIVNFWATWCTTCRDETPDLISLYQQNKEAGLVLLGVDLREADGPVQEFANEFGISYPVVMDRDGQVAGTWHIGGPTNGVPATYFIDRTGVVRLVVFGPLTPDKVQQGLSLIMGTGT